MKLVKRNIFVSSLLTIAILNGCVNLVDNSLVQNNLQSTNLEEETNLKIDDINSSGFEVNEKGFSIKANIPKAGEIIPGKFIVKLKNSSIENNFLNRIKFKKRGDIQKSSKLQLIESGPTDTKALDILKKDPDVEYVEPDRIITLDATYYAFTMTISMYGSTYKYSYNMPVGSTLNLSLNGVSYLYTLQAVNNSPCLSGPAFPSGVTFSLPNCQTSPAPSPTPSKTPSPTPTATATPLPSPTPTVTPTTPVTSTTPTPISTPTTNLTFNDPMFSQQYSHKVAKSLDGWKIFKGTNAVTIAVLDTGIDGTHPEFANKIVTGYSAFAGQVENQDGHGHGTHCAGIAAAAGNNSQGVVGFAYNAKLMPVRVLDNTGSGSISGIAAGLTYAANSTAQVISMSLGGPSDSITLKNAVNYALSKGKIVVAAMGNSGNNSLSFPAAYSGVIAVGATDSNNNRASFSQYGSHISVSAPGVNIVSTLPSNKYGNMSGTSMATPAVAGLAALVKNYQPSLTNTQIKQRIESTSDDFGTAGFDQYYGYGRINTYRAIIGK